MFGKGRTQRTESLKIVLSKLIQTFLHFILYLSFFIIIQIKNYYKIIFFFFFLLFHIKHSYIFYFFTSIKFVTVSTYSFFQVPSQT
jgi:hypothetical protein